MPEPSAPSAYARAIFWVAIFLLVASTAQLFIVSNTASAQDQITPYVLNTEVYAFERDPHGELGIKTTLARRSDGASARVDSIGHISLGLTARRVEFIDGRIVIVVDAIKMKTTPRPIPASALANLNALRLEGTPDCVRMAEETRVGQDTVAGQDVMVVVSESPIFNGQRTRKMTDWRAPALACRTLAYRVEDQQADGSWWLRTEGCVASLKLEESDPKLFDEGADYTEVKPSEIQRKLLELRGIPVDEATWSQEAEQLDKGYPKK
jgi:hypothetical protein